MLQKSKKFRDRGRNRQSRQTRRMLFEPLEDRRLMTADLGGNTLAAPTSLGTLQGTRVISDFVGAADVNDYFRVGIGRQSELRLNLDGLRADADLQLLDSAGRTIASSTRGGSQPESISRTLNAGTYFVRVYQYSGDTNYLLTLWTAPDAPPDYAGNSLNAARNVGALSGTVVFNDFVGQADTADYYRFRIDARSEFQLRLDNMTADADVVLLDSAGRQLTGSYRGGAAAEAIDRVLDSGDYFVHIYPFGGANTDYRLTLTRAAVSNEGWASETGFRAADTSVQRAVAQLATSQVRQASAASRLAHSGGAWYTDVAGGDGQRIRAAFSVYDAWRSQNPTASLPSTTRQAMHDRLSETYTNANTRTELINRIIAVYEARRSGG